MSNRGVAFYDGSGDITRIMIIDATEVTANTLAGETAVTVPAGTQVVPGRTTYSGGDFI